MQRNTELGVDGFEQALVGSTRRLGVSNMRSDRLGQSRGSERRSLIGYTGAITLAIGLLCVDVAGVAVAQERGLAAGSGLTREQRLLIWHSVSNQSNQPVPADFPIVIGMRMPNSISLNDLPSQVRRQSPILEDYRFAKLQDKVLIVSLTGYVIDVLDQESIQRPQP
jgi:hypothetical protein